jgi:DNA-binding GntR family transcriptional regulator
MSDIGCNDSSIQCKSLVQLVIDRLEEEIISGSLAPGQKLLETELAAAWRVSRSPVREAFRILTGQGLLIMKPRLGTFVAPMNRQEIIEIYQIRACLESFAVFLTVQKQDPAVLERLQEVHKAIIAAVADRDEIAYHRLNREFHAILTRSCGNERLIGMLEPLEKHTQRYRFRYKSSVTDFSAIIVSHNRIIELVTEGDPYKAERERKAGILANLPDILARVPATEESFAEPGRRR